MCSVFASLPRRLARFRCAGGSLALLLAVTACEHDPAASREPDPVAPTADAADATNEPLPASTEAASPVLVELFTSQGCSSCPPADALLTALAAESGRDIVPLVFHVDYWDDLGWPDPFGGPQWTARQYGYAEAMGTARVYTPQLLFDGRDHHVGVSRRHSEAAIETAAAERPQVGLTVRSEVGRLRLQATVEPRWLDQAARRRVAIMVAVTDGGHRTAVRRGENAGRELPSEFVARDLRQACSLPAEVDRGSDCEVSLSLAGVEDRATLRVVAFAQDPASWRILGVATHVPTE